MDTYLICEGPADGLDVRVLDLIIAQKLRLEVIIEPACGSSSLGSVAKWLEERSRTRRPDGTLNPPVSRAYVIADRDFRPIEEIEQAWESSDSKRLAWRRHEIENYLLEPRLLADAFLSLKSDGVRGADRLPDTEKSVFELLQDLARPMLEDHAGWLAFWHLASRKSITTDIGLPVRPVRKPSRPSDRPYPGRTEWLEYLRSECRRLRDDCQAILQDNTCDDPTTVYDGFLVQITQPSFLAERRFITELGGHELMSALCAHINRSGVSRLSCSDLATELIKALDRLYEPGFFAPDDFAELADRLR